MTENYVAGFIGWPDGEVTIVNCVNRCDIECNGAVAGGLIGIAGNKTSIYNSINSGNILATQYVGGIIGYYISYYKGDEPFNIINTYNSGKNELNKYIDENSTDEIVLSRWKYNEGEYPTFE